MAQVQRQGGFDCEFVVKPPNALQSECPVCLQVLREPYQTTCCGKSYCRVCIDQLKAGKSKCACCNKPIKDFPNIGLRQSLYDFKVYCGNKSQGCKWVGELRQLEDHLNYNPSTEKQLVGCQFADVQCLYCREQRRRSAIQIHQKNDCPKRPFKCIYCDRYESTYQNVVDNHWPICQYRPVPCPNMCGSKFSQKNVRDLENHIANDCPLTTIDCEYKRVGCNKKVLRKDMTAHLDENIAHHLSLQATEQRKVANSIKMSSDQRSHHMKSLTNGLKLVCENTASHMILTTDVLVEHSKKKKRKDDALWALSIIIIVLATLVAYTSQENREIKDQIAKLTQDVQELRNHASVCPLYITFTNFEQLRLKDEAWYSSPFYTHLKGYKMCLKVNANGRTLRDGTHNIGVFLHLMSGQFDDELEWPFQGTITVQLLNQRYGGKKENVEMTYNFSDTTPLQITRRVSGRERALTGLGYGAFTSYANLWSNHLKNDRLVFLINC